MVDIAAQLSLTPSGPAIDPAAILGADTADTQAFGNILAGQLGVNADTGAPAAPLPPLPFPAGDRQPGGKVLPGVVQILPDAAVVGVEAPAAQALPSLSLVAGQTVSAALTERLAASVPQNSEGVTAEGDGAAAAQVKHAEGSPVHALIKKLAAALKGEQPKADEESEGADQDAAGSDAETASPDASGARAAPLALSILPTTASATAVRVRATNAAPGFGLPLTASSTAVAATAKKVQADAAQLAAQPVPAEAQSVPVLTVAAEQDAAAAPAVTLLTSPAASVGRTVAARIKVETAQPQGSQRPAADRTTSAALAAPAAPVDATAAVAAPAVRSIIADRAAQAEHAKPEFAAAPAVSVVADAPAPAGVAPVTAASTAPIVEMPRQDFAALVERLVEARNASATQSTHASVNHAEFGQVSLHFKQDGGDLTVGMSSADPEFTVAVQAAMPADRQNFTSDGNPRGQSQSQSQGQTQNQSQSAANSSSQSHHEAAGQRSAEGGDQPGRGRNQRGGTNPSNPSQRWSDRDQPQSRSGIFA